MVVYHIVRATHLVKRKRAEWFFLRGSRLIWYEENTSWDPKLRFSKNSLIFGDFIHVQTWKADKWFVRDSEEFPGWGLGISILPKPLLITFFGIYASFLVRISPKCGWLPSKPSKNWSKPLGIFSNKDWWEKTSKHHGSILYGGNFPSMTLI